MAKVLFVKANEKNTRYKLGVEDELESSSYNISSATYASIGVPKRGAPLSECDLVDIRRDDELYRATKKAYSLIGASDKSRYALKVKLLQAGFSSEAAGEAIARCLELGYLDESRQLLRAVEREANYNLKGKYHVKRKLAGKGYSLSDIDSAIRTLVECGDVDFEANFERLAEKRGAETDEERLALKYRFGYKI
ncbi:MAG: RecX family transcriptional regulator [Clostridia bacterium]|nr:RecX family transcriptional regulator [Clostridia bacterium]